jgi:hypothetical protein
VPEAAIDVHGDLRRPKDDVGLATRTGKQATVDAKPQPAGMQCSPEAYFRVRVLRAL